MDADDSVCSSLNRFIWISYNKLYHFNCECVDIADCVQKHKKKPKATNPLPKKQWNCKLSANHLSSVHIRWFSSGVFFCKSSEHSIAVIIVCVHTTQLFCLSLRYLELNRIQTMVWLQSLNRAVPPLYTSMTVTKLQ